MPHLKYVKGFSAILEDCENLVIIKIVRGEVNSPDILNNFNLGLYGEHRTRGG